MCCVVADLAVAVHDRVVVALLVSVALVVVVLAAVVEHLVAVVEPLVV